MKTRPAFPARGWLLCAATGLLLFGPAISQAQTQFGSRSSAKTTAAKPKKTAGSNPLVTALQRELGKLYAGGRKEKAAATATSGVKTAEGTRSSRTPQIKKRNPGLLPFFNRSNKTTSASKTRKSSRTIQQTAARQPSRTQSKKPSMFDRFLGRGKRTGSNSRSSQAKNTPGLAPAEKPLIGLRGIPRLLPKFLQPKQLPRDAARTARTTRTTPPRTASRSTGIPVLNTQAASTSGAKLQFADPFTDVSEAEADKKQATPFSGLKLEPEQPTVETTADAATTESTDETIEQQDDAENEEIQAKLQRLAERADLGGLKGFCPVVLRDERNLVDANPELSSTYNGQTFNFSTEEAKEKFDADSAKYAPIHNGHDVIVLTDGQVELEGSLDHAVWFKNRLYLFSSTETLATFVGNPVKYLKTDTDNTDAEKSDTEEEAEATTDTETEIETDDSDASATNSDNGEIDDDE